MNYGKRFNSCKVALFRLKLNISKTEQGFLINLTKVLKVWKLLFFSRVYTYMIIEKINKVSLNKKRTCWSPEFICGLLENLSFGKNVLCKV